MSPQTYRRLNVETYVKKFCGWQPIEDMIQYAERARDKFFFTCLIKTGGRATEVLALAKQNFRVDDPFIIVSDMQLEKQYRKIRDAPEGEPGTEKIYALRNDFSIPMKEPLSKELLSGLSNVTGDLLFPSPYKLDTHRPLSRIRMYQLIRELNDRLPYSLREKLGLTVPFMDPTRTEKISDEIHLWLHWARSQRASQLAAEYEFTEGELMEWFGWKDIKTATRYAHKGYAKLGAKMLLHAH
jgi:integrase